MTKEEFETAQLEGKGKAPILRRDEAGKLKTVPYRNSLPTGAKAAGLRQAAYSGGKMKFR